MMSQTFAMSRKPLQQAVRYQLYWDIVAPTVANQSPTDSPPLVWGCFACTLTANKTPQVPHPGQPANVGKEVSWMQLQVTGKQPWLFPSHRSSSRNGIISQAVAFVVTSFLSCLSFQGESSVPGRLCIPDVCCRHQQHDKLSEPRLENSIFGALTCLQPRSFITVTNISLFKDTQTSRNSYIIYCSSTDLGWSGRVKAM